MGLKVEITEPKDRPKDGGNPGGSQATGKDKKKKESKRKVTKENLKKAGKKAVKEFIRPGMSRYEALAKKRRKALKERIEKGEPDQGMMDRQSKDDADEVKSIGIDSKKGINIKKGGLILKVTNRGPMHRSNNRKS